MRHRKPCEHFRHYNRGPKLINRGVHYRSVVSKNPKFEIIKKPPFSLEKPGGIIPVRAGAKVISDMYPIERKTSEILQSLPTLRRGLRDRAIELDKKSIRGLSERERMEHRDVTSDLIKIREIDDFLKFIEGKKGELTPAEKRSFKDPDIKVREIYNFLENIERRYGGSLKVPKQIDKKEIIRLGYRP